MKTIFSELETYQDMHTRAKTEGAKRHLEIKIERLKSQLIQESEDALLYI